MNDFITIITFSNYHEMIVLRGHLEAAGIPCIVPNENTIQIQPLYSDSLGGFQLQVHKNDYNKAAKILIEGGYQVQNKDYEKSKASGNENSTNILKWFLILFVSFALISLTYKICKLYDEYKMVNKVKGIVGKYWCVEEIIFKDKRYVPNTKNEDFILTNDISCKESFRINADFTLLLPGFDSPKGIGTWHLEENNLVLSTIDTLKEVFNHSFEVEIVKDLLTLSSKETRIKCRKYKGPNVFNTY